MTKLAVIQLSTTDDFEKNLKNLSEFLKKASDNQAKHIFTPENTDIMLPNHMIQGYDFLYTSQKFIDFIQKKASDLKVTIHIGSIKVPISSDTTKTYNQSMSIDTQGKIVAYYNKIHLFDASIVSDNDYKESTYIQAGDTFKFYRFKEFTLGYSICYDIRFPYLYQFLSDNNVDMISIPAAFTELTGKAHWETLVRARAIENSCYVVAAAQVGVHFGKRKTYGNSLIISPWGDILGQGDSFFEDIVYAEFHKDILEAARSQINSLKHRRKIALNL